MDCEIINACLDHVKSIDYTTIFAAISVVIAAIAACFAIFSYRLSKKIRDEIKSDEVLVASKILHPDLNERDHAQCVIYFTLLNKSHRKASITSLKAFDTKGSEIPVEWSDSIDRLGSIQNPTGLLGLKDSTEIYIRKNDGEGYFITTIRIKHSFNEAGLELTYFP